MIEVYTDGACSSNGKNNANAGIGVYFGKNDPRNVSKTITGKQTNNTAELKAIYEVYRILKKEIKQGEEVTIYTDSIYALRCVTTYGKKQNENNWKKSIPNLELVKKIYKTFSKYPNVSFSHIKAHTNKKDKHSIGNYYADKLAVEAIQINS
ncbi:MAG: hypothetical protein CMF62_01985 [Magnetococcales bacterium]|nr:hypothetical protein [Magnetococcales bacterium]|tara:strand:+ start:131701 stop:132156 length:456 start_codon:yes stop_codon:yes gene_type:complete